MLRRAEKRASGMLRKRKPRSRQTVIAEQAVAFGVTIPSEPTAAERFLSPNEIGKILNVTGEAVKQWIYHRRLPAIKLNNGYWKVRVADFESFLKARRELGRRRVLVTGRAGDLPEVVAAIEKLGHQPVLGHNYADVLLKAFDHYPALFIINVSQVEADAWKLAAKLRTSKPLRSVPMLLLADAELSEAEADRALRLGAQGFLKRPLQTAVLLQEMERLVSRA